MSRDWPTFQPLSGGPVAWRGGTYEPDHWYAVVWDNLSGQWSVHPTLGPFRTAREAEQAGQEMAAEQAAAARQTVRLATPVASVLGLVDHNGAVRILEHVQPRVFSACCD